MDFSRVKVSVHVPPEATRAVQNALGNAGAGVIGEYSFCSFVVRGAGYSIPSDAAKPYYQGRSGNLAEAAEDRVEVICDRSKAKAVITAMKAVHPHEEVAFDIVPLLEVEDV